MKTILCLFTLLISANAFAQFGLIKTDILDDIKTKKVIVELKQAIAPDGVEMTEKQKTAQKHFVKSYNEAIQKVLPGLWQLTTGGVEFKTTEEINKMSDADLDPYVRFHSGYITKRNEVQGSFLMYGFNIDYFNAKGKRVKVFEVTYVPDEFIGEADIIFVSKVLNNHIEVSRKTTKYTEYFDIDDNIAKVSSKTVLLDKELTNLTLAEAQKKYPHKLEIVEPNKISQAIIDANKEHVFMKLVWSTTRKMAQYDAFDTETCNIVACVGTGGLKVKMSYKFPKYHGPGGSSNFYDPSRYPYKSPWGGKEIFSIQLYKSKLSIKGVHLKSMLGKGMQKMNCK